MAKAGANEVLTYSFVNASLFDKVGQDKNLAYQIVNALSPDLGYYRISLLPSLLDKVHLNVKAGFQEFILFEMNKVHIKNHPDEAEPDLPAEDYRLAMVIAVDDKFAKADYSGAPYYLAKYYLDYLLYTLGIDYEIKNYNNEEKNDHIVQPAKPFEPIRTGIVEIEGDPVGLIGEPTSSVRDNLKLPKFSAMLELDLLKLLKHRKSLGYSKLADYPHIEQDVCFKVADNIAYHDLYALLSSELDKLTENSHISLTPLDIFQRDDDKSHKQITFRIRITSYEKTLKTEEFNSLISSLGAVAKDRFGAEII